MRLRPYQVAMVDQLRAAYRHSRAVVGVLPTGGGKTITAADGVIRPAVERGRRVLTLAHRAELIEQMSEKLDEVGVDHGVIKAGHRRADLSAPVQVASVSTLTRRLQKLAAPETYGSPVVPMWARPFDLIVVDECHHTPAASYRRVLDAWPDALVLGLTATPYRLDGSGLDHHYEHMVVGRHVSDLIRDKYLVPCRVFAFDPPDGLMDIHRRGGDFVQAEAASVLDKQATTDELVSNWSRYAADRITAVFATGVEHAEHVAAAYRAAGVPAAAIDGTTPGAERDRVLGDLRAGRMRVVVNVMLLTEGWDLPELGCVQLARPTDSRALWRQMIGRGMRTCPGKSDCIVLDHVGSCLRFGSPNDDDAYALHVPTRRRTKADLRVQRATRCPTCSALLGLGESVCPHCGLVLSRDAGVEYRRATDLREMSGSGELDGYRYFLWCLHRCRTAGKAAKQYQIHRGKWPAAAWKVAAGSYTAIHAKRPHPRLLQQARDWAQRVGVECIGS